MTLKIYNRLLFICILPIVLITAFLSLFSSGAYAAANDPIDDNDILFITKPSDGYLLSTAFLNEASLEKRAFIGTGHFEINKRNRWKIVETGLFLEDYITRPGRFSSTKVLKITADNRELKPADLRIGQKLRVHWSRIGYDVEVINFEPTMKSLRLIIDLPDAQFSEIEQLTFYIRTYLSWLLPPSLRFDDLLVSDNIGWVNVTYRKNEAKTKWMIRNEEFSENLDIVTHLTDTSLDSNWRHLSLRGWYKPGPTTYERDWDCVKALSNVPLFQIINPVEELKKREKIEVEVQKKREKIEQAYKLCVTKAKKTCETECCELLKHEQLKQDIAVETCFAQLCQ